MAMNKLQEQFGPIDIYLFDQVLKGRIAPGMRILDAGCGSGRNLVYFLREGYEVFGVDEDPQAVESVRELARNLAPNGIGRTADSNFRTEVVERMSFGSGFADVVISSAVLHFARDDAHFGAMVEGAWRATKRGGTFFCRLASTIGIENEVRRIAGRRFLVPDGSERYLVDAPLLESLTERMGGELLEPLKTTVVQRQRAMTTWVART